MTNNAFNPFMMPNFGQAGAESATNPLIASMEMMRHAMAGMSAKSAGDASGSGMGAGLNFAQALNPEEIERRISELKVVENWLKLNLSMLTSTIQGLEVQLATIQTLKSFAAMGAQANEASQSMHNAWSETANQANAAGTVNAATNAATSYGTSGAPSSAHSTQPIDGQSPLEAALGMQPSAQSAAHAARSAGSAPDHKAQAVTSANTESGSGHADAASTYATAIPPAGQAWWNMLEKQFSQIATATQEATQVANAAAAKLVKSQVSAQTPVKKTAIKKTTSTRQTANKAPAQPKASTNSRKPSGTKATAAPRVISRT